MHAVIAGTGRAGTSFLLEYLAACGVPAGDLNGLLYFADADAGYERRISDRDLPYLFKDPLLHEHLHALDQHEIGLDALIVPVRDLRQAAESRVLRERTTITKAWSSAEPPLTSSATAGGVVFSLSLDDQERLLAVGLARLVNWAVQRNVPLFLVAFPRLVEDADYVIDTLWPWLQRFTDRETARAEHNRLADPSKVHVRPVPPARVSADDLRIENAAMATALADLRAQLAGTDALTYQVRVLKALERIEKKVGQRAGRQRDPERGTN